jgi:hypothetical protein
MIDMNQFGRKARAKAVPMGKREAKALFTKADAAGMAAIAACTPVPMIVGSAKSLFSNEMDPNKPQYFVADGVCGFAWIEIRPSRGGIATWMKENGYGRYDDYRRCHYMSARENSQSMQKKEAYCHAFADVMRDAGIDCSTASRMD